MDKVLHLAEYLAFGLFLSLPVRDLGIRQLEFIVPPGAAFAALDEAVQTFVPGRTGDPLDFAVDVIGLVIAAMLVLAWDWRRVRREGSSEH